MKKREIRSTVVISVNHDLVWQISDADNYCFSKDGRCFNILRSKELRRVLVGGSVGYCINGKFQSLKKIRTKLIRIKESEVPF